MTKWTDKNQTEYLLSNLRAMNLWLTANELRSVRSENRKLATSGVNFTYLKELDRSLVKTFSFNLYDRDDLNMLVLLDEYANTLVSQEQFFEKIYGYIQKNGEK